MSGPASRNSLGIAILGCGRIAGRHAQAIGRVRAKLAERGAFGPSEFDLRTQGPHSA